MVAIIVRLIVQKTVNRMPIGLSIDVLYKRTAWLCCMRRHGSVHVNACTVGLIRMKINIFSYNSLYIRYFHLFYRFFLDKKGQISHYLIIHVYFQSIHKNANTSTGLS